jgi:hypothetical protein
MLKNLAANNFVADIQSPKTNDNVVDVMTTVSRAKALHSAAAASVLNKACRDKEI